MEFLRTIKKSIYDRDFYSKIKTGDFASALKYYTLFILCIAFVVAIPLGISFFMFSSHIKDSGDVRATALDIYPNELVLNLKDGQMASNVPEPFGILMPKAFDVKQSTNLIVINTRGTISPVDFKRYNTAVILGGDALWIYDSKNDKIEIQKFSKMNAGVLVVNKQKVTEWINLVFRIGEKIIIVLLVLLPLFLFSFFWFAYLFYLLFGAVIIWIIAKLRKVDITYGQSYKLGLYLITLPILYGVLSVASLSVLRIPFGFTIVLALVTYINIISQKSVEEKNGEKNKKEEIETAKDGDVPKIQEAEIILVGPDSTPVTSDTSAVKESETK